jgi:hypothetical protein
METRRSHLGGPVEHSEEKGKESLGAILRFLCGSPRLCQLRSKGLVPVSKYWTYWSHAGDMGPVSVVAYSSINIWLKCTASMVVLWEKLRRVPRATQPGWEVESGALFLGSSEFIQLCWVSVKGCHVKGPPIESVRVSYVDWCGKHTHWSGFPLQGIHRFKSS